MFIDTLRGYSSMGVLDFTIYQHVRIQLGNNLFSDCEKGEHHGISWNIPRGGMFSSRAHFKITIKLPNILGGATQGGNNLRFNTGIISRSQYLTPILNNEMK